MLYVISTVSKAADFISLFPWLRNILANGFDYTGVITANQCPVRSKVVDMLPIGWVEGYGDGLDEDIAIAEFGDGVIGDYGGFTRALDDDCFLGLGKRHVRRLVKIGFRA